jgi:hypothetical protein
MGVKWDYMLVLGEGVGEKATKIGLGYKKG